MSNSLIKEEWINGVVMMSPRPEYNHMEIMRVIGRCLDEYFKGKCKVAIENALFLTKENPIDLKQDLIRLKALVTAKKAELAPDIAVYCDKNQIFRRGFLGVPQLIVEVLSPGNSTDDTEKKKVIYEKYGVPEYWIVNPATKEVFIYSIENNKYELISEVNFKEKEITSARLEDLTINIKDIELYESDEFDY